ncbi:hypothetical protein CFELI_04375 [Corynebacterium felinum]|uniref:Uncharacterized protein n=1 Tax=Corynebacterium felinum TaxID=131318 RepID=A0ABU2BAZ7_9CORY|nr:hypothetical protein [Corynebacterium felinum]WJY94505.1 hypothetical protein CFELI_04375 [Corynebacterium felinum]
MNLTYGGVRGLPGNPAPYSIFPLRISNSGGVNHKVGCDVDMQNALQGDLTPVW